MSFRPIAPAQPQMYAASCNPPRRAKRARADSPVPVSPDDPPKRRGRRPGTLSRAAREAQRKANHSLIEKARRTKINDALAALRELVPSPDDSDDDDRRHKPEKEFKLEILVRTVAHLRALTDRVTQLEHGCPRCEPEPEPRLPSISAWLSSEEAQLPTPPTSGTCAPATAGFPLPPVLTLPSPRTFLPTRFSGFTPRAVHTPDDETAASLLLRMSTRSEAECALTPSRLLGLSAER
jgi:hypothetical protein